MDGPKATLTKEGEVSIIALNDGKANVFSPAMIKDVNSCFNLVGKTEREWGGSDKENKYTWFSINVDPNTGLVTKKCGNPSALQCKKGNTW